MSFLALLVLGLIAGGTILIGLLLGRERGLERTLIRGLHRLVQHAFHDRCRDRPVQPNPGWTTQESVFFVFRRFVCSHAVEDKAPTTCPP